MTISRRQFLRLAAGASGLLTTACQSFLSSQQTRARIAIVGGGFAGATAAKYLKQLDPSLEVSLVEQNQRYITCPGSNWVLGGFQNMDALTFDYSRLSQRYGIQVIHTKVEAVDPVKQTLTLANGETNHYDRLVVAPGISFRWNEIDGYDEQTAEFIPHAWKAGRQTLLLQQQIKAMPANGTIIISAPANPFRCPPGPYERASLFAYYCQRHKPSAKIIILDHKRSFAKQSLFIQGWKRHYGFGSGNSLIEWHSLADNPVLTLAAKSKTLITDFGDRFQADVINLIPPQQAGLFAKRAGLTDDSGWCPVKPISSESLLQPNIYVIGDAAIQTPMPKSAFAANSQAKACAFAIIRDLQGKEPLEPVWMNTCYSLLTPEQAISIAMVYKLNERGIIAAVPGAGGVSNHTDPASLSLEAQYTHEWYNHITTDTFS